MARRRPNRTTTAVTVVAAALALLPGAGLATASPAARASSGDDRSALVRELLSRTRGQARIAHDQRSGRVTFVGAGKARVVTRPSDVPVTGSADAAARAYLRHLAPLTGVGEQAVRSPEVLDQPWGSTVHYQQTSGGVPVFGGEVTVSLDRSHQLTAYSASTSDTTVDTTPRVTATQAAHIAARVPVRTDHVPAASVRTGAPVLSVYDSRLLGMPGPRAQALVWRTEVTALGRPDVREIVLVDAHRGAVALHFSEVDGAENRSVCDADNARPADDQGCTAPVRTEGGTTTGSLPLVDPAQVDAAYQNAGYTYDFYRDVLGRDSVDDHGLPLLSTVRYCPPANDPDPTCPMTNAFWNGAQMFYGNDYATADDVVGHELTHGVTQYTSELVYLLQPGAINESMSDVMGELIDQLDHSPGDDPATNWMVGEDLPDGALRSMKNPLVSRAGPQPDRMTSDKWEPGSDDQGLWDAGGVHVNSGVGNKAAYLIAEGTRLEPGDAFNGMTFDGMTDSSGVPLSGTDPLGTSSADRRDEVLKKVANLYYTVEHMLTPSATYSDLGNLLPQACQALVSVGTVRGLRFTDADCTAVQHAVDATEMSKAPVVAGATPRPEAPLCTNGGSPTMTWSDGFESPSDSVDRWAVNPAPTADTGAAWYPDPTALTVAPDFGIYPHSGSSNLWGDDPDGNGTPRELTAEPVFEGTRTSPVGITPDKGTYLWFAHFYGFEQADDKDTGEHEFYDGGQVQYSVDGGAWTDAGSLFAENGYTGSISSVYDNKHAGQRAFVGTSPGYTASRLYLGGFSGKKVRIRFLVEADSAGGDYGWYVDDVKVYSCNATSLSVNKPTVRYGQAATLSGTLTVAGTTKWINGATVALLQRRPGTSTWYHQASTRTSGYGNYSFAGFKPAQNWDFRVEYEGGSPFAATASQTTIYVAPLVSVKSTATSFRLGGTVTLSGTVSPNHHGQYVYLQRYLGSGRWTTVTSRVLSSTSTYLLPWKPPARAAYVLRVVKNPDSDHAGATSSNVTIHVS